MALTFSTMLPLGTTAPTFTLPNVINNKIFSLASVAPQTGTVIMFVCNHCPFVKHIMEKLLEIVNTYQTQGIQFIAISSNDINNYPDDAPEKMQVLAKKLNFNFPYLYDEDQSVAKAYLAACTPDFYLFDSSLKLAYRGRLDDSTPGNKIPVSGKDLKKALDCLLTHTPLSPEQHPSQGCNIKWKDEVKLN